MRERSSPKTSLGSDTN